MIKLQNRHTNAGKQDTNKPWKARAETEGMKDIAGHTEGIKDIAEQSNPASLLRRRLLSHAMTSHASR